MTCPKDDGSEERALDALGMLAFLTRHSKHWTEEDAARFIREASRADLTPEEIEGTGDFAFETMWARIKEGQECPPPVEAGTERVAEAMYAMHRGKTDIPPEALAELERRRREALGDEEE